MQPKALVSVQNFHMKFGQKTVIEDLSFRAHEGEVFGFLGANGSGKTTTIRTLLGIYEPTSGELLINGKRFDSSESSFLSYLPEERGLYRKEAVLEVMIYFGRLKGFSRNEAKSWSLEYLDRVDLAEMAHQKVSKLSGGQQQKVQFGIAVMNDPKLLILDEPTKGLDPLNRRLMIDIIHERVEKGATVILVTHHMDEVERLCDRVMLLKDGKRRIYGPIDEVREKYGRGVLQVRFSGTFPENEKLYAISSKEMGSAEVSLKEGVTQKDVLKFLLEREGLQIDSFTSGGASLEDLFVSVYGTSQSDTSEQTKDAYA